jgi:catecholate siderophore receptor
LSISYEYLNQERFIDRGIPTNSNGKPVESYKDIVFGDSSKNFSTHEAHIVHAIYEHEISDSLNGRFSAHHNNHDKLYQNLYVPNTFKRKGYGVDINGDDISVEHSGYQEANGTVVLDGYRDTTKRQTSTLSYEIHGEFEVGGLVNNIIAGLEYLEIENNNDRYHANWLPDNNFDGDTEYFNVMRPMSVNGNIGETNSTRSTNYYDGSNANLADRTFADVKVLSLYLVDELALMDTLDLVLGVRYDNMDFDVDTINTTTYASSPRSDSDETISPRVGLVFNPLEALSLYTNYSETFSPKAGDQYAKLSSNAEKLDPDTFENIEYGLSYDLPMGLRLSASYFEIEAHKPSWNSTRQASEMEKSEISGYELELIGSLTSQWFLSAAYTNLDAHNDSGVRLKETPENVFSIWNNYLVSDRLAVNLGIIHQDESHITNGSTAKLPEYTRVDAGASYMLTDSTRIGLNIENLTDELYFPHSHGTHQASVGAPINAMLSITSTF